MQLDLNLERLRMAIEDLLVKLAKMFAKPKLQTIFLINNYDLTISILKVEILGLILNGNLFCYSNFPVC